MSVVDPHARASDDFMAKLTREGESVVMLRDVRSRTVGAFKEGDF